MGDTDRRYGFEYAVPVPTDERRGLARGWLWLGLLALIGSGLLSVLLVLSRTPGINRLFSNVDFFRIALVVHVDLSVLVWFVAVAGLLWSIEGVRIGLRWGWAALGLAGCGAACMALAPFISPGEAIMANYIPMLDGPLFIAGLLLLALGVTLLVLRAMFSAPKVGFEIHGVAALRFGINAAAVATAVALLAFFWSWMVVPQGLAGKAYYEILYWGGGHALQFTWTLLMLVCWLWLASACGVQLPISPRLVVLMFVLALISVFVTPYAYLAHDVTSVEHRSLHTWTMRLGGGLAIAPIALAVILGLRRAPVCASENQPLRAALIASMTLFALGGVIGIFISSSNVTIPAHYHGSIVGVTLAFMGLVYHLLPRLGYRPVQGRWARLQPVVYGGGQLLHIIGLVWSGGYGVQRKVAGADQVLRSTSEIAGMGLMGAGGLIAIIGGLMFVILVLGAMVRSPNEKALITS